MKDNAYYSEADITRKWDAALVEKVDTTPKYICQIPEDFKALFEGLSIEEKDKIHAQAQSFKLDTEYQIKNFWQTRTSLRRQKTIGLITLNEQESATNKTNVPYNLRNIADEIGKRFNK